MHHIAIIGSGPAGYYTAEACQQLFGDSVHVDIIDRSPAPFGLIRNGVAPDHQTIKGVSHRYEAIALSDTVRFCGHVSVGQDVTIPELLDMYDAVVLATGAPSDASLDIPGADLPGVIGSAAFVGWYNGHPDHAGLTPDVDGKAIAVIGNGNVALDVARILAKSAREFEGSDIVAHAREALTHAQPRRITIVGRRGPHQVTMTNKELGELGKLDRASPLVSPADLPPIEEDAVLDPSHRKSVAHLREFALSRATKPITIEFDFFAIPVAVEGNGKAERLIVERSTLDADGHGVGTGERYAIPADLVVSCIGYRTPPIADVPYDEGLGRFANQDGLIAPGLYCVGWARRGPTGTIGTNKPDGFMIAERIAADIPQGAGKAGRAGLDRLLSDRGVDVVTFHDWQKIDQVEIDRARNGAPREKFVDVDSMIAAKNG
ncbi:FAD-dependent oxidoreductase [Sphingobium sufflavum]|uniref:FAD-dependent oxidoreductase n=1 Tax=Sphingobium sufflavum TaxID=1129547 RepID=UPI001F399CAE|nr:FAD-dependent oxidoreductase [Sphingobium sufflavum]MCE7796815.1 FAD-dependent oxidoreductase [Sphingobium sufflavum]